MDPWLLKILDRLKSARTRMELQAILDDLEDQYESFSGPGLEVIDQLLEETRRRLADTPS